jgi:hypothetical protein
MEATMEKTMPMDRLARIYIKMRTRMQEIQAEYDTKLEEIKAQQQEVKNAMKDQMMALGSKFVRTDYGTVTLKQTTRYYTQDWDSFKQFVLDHEALDLLEHRIAQRNMALFLQENPKDVPPGLNSVSEIDVTVTPPGRRKFQ